MIIQENIENYRIVIYFDDVMQIRKSLESIIEDIKEASGLVGKPLGEVKTTFYPEDRSWVVFIEKEKKKDDEGYCWL